MVTKIKPVTFDTMLILVSLLLRLGSVYVKMSLLFGFMNERPSKEEIIRRL